MTTLNQFAKLIQASTETEIKRDAGLAGKLRLRQEGQFTIDYAPFEYIEPNARIVIVGITPGAQQAQNALLKARQVLNSGLGEQEAIKAAKVFASFSGPMRSNLIAMLDHIGVQKMLGLKSTELLWKEKSSLAHFTSALRYPVYFNAKNYSGSPAISNSPALTWMLESFLTHEAQTLPNAIWVPLGPSAAACLKWIVQKGYLDETRVLWDLPHPSGANAERIAYFLGRKARENLSPKTSALKIDEAKRSLKSQIETMQHAL